MATPFDPVEYEEDVKARAAAAEEAALTEEVEAEVAKVGPAAAYTLTWGFTKRLPKNLAKGMYLGLLNMAETLDDVAGAVGGPPGPTMSEELGLDVEKMQALPKTFPARVMFPEVFESAHALANEFNEDATTADLVTQGIAQFVIPFTGWLKALGGFSNASKMQKVGRAVTAEAATVGTAFDPHEGRVADLLQTGRQMENEFGRTLNTLIPDESAFNAYINMISDRENESRWEGRFKNIVDSLVTTGAGAVFIKAVPATLRAARQMVETTAADSVKFKQSAIETAFSKDVKNTPKTKAESLAPLDLEATSPFSKAFLTEAERIEALKLQRNAVADVLSRADDAEQAKKLKLLQDTLDNELTDIERARALKNTVVEEVEGEHIVLEGDDLNTEAEIVPINKDKK